MERRQEGVVLLAVLWLVVALSVIAMSTSYLVRTEVEAASNQREALGSYYLARGGMEAAIYSLVRSSGAFPGGAIETNPTERFFPGQRWLRYEFPGGDCLVEVVPENAKLNVNQASEEQLTRLFSALGLPVAESFELAQAIVDWRSPRASTVGSPFDLFYAALQPPYPSRHAPLEHLEELLPVKGMSRELFFGRIEQMPDGRWRKSPPLADLLTSESTARAGNPNYAAAEGLQALPGWTEAMAAAVVRARAVAPFASLAELQSAVPEVTSVVALSPLTFSTGPVYTLTATAFLPDSQVRRSVRVLAQVGASLPLYHHVLGWWEDWPWSGEPPQPDLLPRRSSTRL